MTGVGSARRTTRADVARQAGVSTAVVSYVVNDGPRPVAPATAERVRDAMRILRYQPDLNARALKRGKSQTLGFVLPGSLNPFFLELTNAVESAAARRGHRLLVADSHGSPELEEQLVSELMGRRVEGLLLVSSFRRSTPSSPLPVHETPLVLLDCPGPVPGLHTIGPDALEGAAVAVGHLIHTHGRRRVGLILGLGFGTPDPRRLGWERALRDAGLPPGPIATADWTPEGGYMAAVELLAGPEAPDSIFVTSDSQALGTLRALHQAGLDVGRDVPVVSFDGTQSSRWAWPSLTSVRQPLEAMAEEALNIVHSPSTPPRHHPFNVDLIIGTSCGCHDIP